MFMPGWDKNFLKVDTHVLLKEATKDYFRDKETMKTQIFRLFF